MSQTPNPQDPYGTEPGSSAPQQPFGETPETDAQQSPVPQQPPADAPQPPAPHGESASGDVPAPTSDPALHPHDPYAYDPSAPQAPAPAGESTGQGPQADPGSYGAAPQDPAPADFGGASNDQYGQGGFAQPGPTPGSYDQGAAYGGAAAGAAGHAGQQAGVSDVPPAGVQGVYEGPLNGQPASESDTKLWSMLAHLSAIAGYILGVGWLGWLGPLIIFLVFKDRNRYVRYNAAEALNAAITVVIASVVLWIGIGILGVVTFSVGWLLFPIAYIPALIHGIFAIIAAVKVNERTWWNYPVNLRMFK